MSATEIGGRYRIEGRLGFGGMSTVHRAFDQRLERRVAVKLLAEHLADDPTFVSRFQREAQAAARLVHPNIVQVFDSGQDGVSGQYFIVMEYIEGSSCAEILRDDGWVEVQEAIAIIEQACEGLHYAHRHGVVHREVKLADFGIAKATEQSSITQVGSVLGTAAYLAPEQARGEEAGPAADLYALGVVTYQLISGRLPYEAASLTELALKQQQEAPATLDTLVAAVSPELADAVVIALALEPADRYRSAREMGRALTDGAMGIAPQRHIAAAAGSATEATRLVQRAQPATAATRVERSAGSGAVVPRRPRPGPARSAPLAEPQPAPAPARARRGGGARRALLALAALAALAAVLIAALLANETQTTIKLRNVVSSEVKQAEREISQLVSENTK
jgi:serine/threonine-protein kinase